MTSSGLSVYGEHFYLTPAGTMPDFRCKLDTPEDDIWGTESRTTDNFNSRTLAWGIPHPDFRGKRVLKIAATNDLVFLNTRSKPIFRHPNWEISIPNIVFALGSLASSMDEIWKTACKQLQTCYPANQDLVENLCT